MARPTIHAAWSASAHAGRAKRGATCAHAAKVLKSDTELRDLDRIEAVDAAERTKAETELSGLSGRLRRLVLAASPAEADATTANRKPLHALDCPLGVLFADELDEAAALTGRDLGVRDFAKRREKCLQSFLRNEAAESADEDGGVIRVGRIDATGDARRWIVALARAAAAGTERGERRDFGPSLTGKGCIDVWVADGPRILLRRSAERKGVTAGRD